MSGITADVRRRAAVAGLAVLLAGCTPAASGPSATQATTSGPSPSVSAFGPPLADDLDGGVPVQLGSVDHWVIDESTAFVADQDGSVRAIDLNTGGVSWQTAYPASGTPWDGPPTIGLSSDRTTVLALRTVDVPAGAQLQLLRLAAATGAVLDARQVGDPQRQWRTDLPPTVLAADAETLVIAEQPETGRQAGVIELATATMSWARSEQAYAADEARVYTRSGALQRPTGAVDWRTKDQVGPLLALSGESVVLFDPERSRVVWLDAGTGARRGATEPVGDPEECRPATSVLVCVGAEPAGYDLDTGKALWRTRTAAHAVETLDDWGYLFTGSTRGYVVDAVTGDVLVRDAELPALRFSNTSGILVGGDADTWVAR